MELSLYRRHRDDCKHRAQGANYTRCSCPIWCDGKLHGRRFRRSVGLCDWARAVKRVERWEEKPEVVQRSETVGACVESYLADCTARKLAESTLRSYKYTLTSLVTFCDSRGIDDLAALNVATLTDFRNSIKGRTTRVHAADCPEAKHRAGRRRCACPIVELPVSAKTQRKALETLRGFCSFAVEREWMKVNIATKIKPPQDDGAPTMPFTPEEITSLLSACYKIENLYNDGAARARLRARALVLLLLYSGFRISDAVGLKRDRLDMQTGRLLVRVMKTRRPLYVRLHRDAVSALAALPVESEYFLWSGRSKLSTAIGSARRTIDCLCRKTGIAGHPHRFRDTFAVRLLEQGEDIRTVQLLLGHSSVVTTEKHYAPWVSSMQDRLDRAAEKLDFTATSPGAPAQPRPLGFVN